MAISSKKRERELYGPSMFEVTLGAALSLILGAILAAGYLVAQPVETVRSLPREPDPDKVYYVTGSSRSSLGKQWLRKKQILMEPGAVQVELTEDELNTWLSSSMAQPDDDEESGIISVGKMNLRLRDDALQIGLPCDISVLGHNQSIVIQSRGGFQSDGDRFNYVPNEIMVGQLAAHRLPVIGGFVINRLFSGHDIPEDIEDAWDSLDDVSVQGDKLILVRK
ncbi:MAG: hypothetical protein SynsKO_42470 [Synoicihabitans sp.]